MTGLGWLLLLYGLASSSKPGPSSAPGLTTDANGNGLGPEQTINGWRIRVRFKDGAWQGGILQPNGQALWTVNVASRGDALIAASNWARGHVNTGYQPGTGWP